MRVFSLFSGIGGFEIPMIELGWEIVGHSEIDKYANIIYDKHFKVKNYGDVKEIGPEKLPDFDMLCGGFPCQSFSIAGKRGGIYNDKQARGTLFYEIIRIAKVKRPRIIFLENVKGLLSSGYGYDFAEIIGELQDTMVQLWGSDWRIEWEVLNTKNFGIPQNRERVFIIARHIGKESGQKIFPIGKNDKKDNGNEIIYFKNSEHQQYRIIDYNGISETLQTNHKPIIRIYDIYNDNIREDGNFRTLINHNNFRILKSDKVRNPTPIECERLQGFPDRFTEGISDSQRYKVLGNAVTVNVIRAIVEKINEKRISKEFEK